MLETPVELKHGAILGQDVHLDPFDALLQAIEDMPYAVPILLGDPVHPAESNLGLVVGTITLWWYDANLIGL